MSWSAPRSRRIGALLVAALACTFGALPAVPAVPAAAAPVVVQQPGPLPAPDACSDPALAPTPTCTGTSLPAPTPTPTPTRPGVDCSSPFYWSLPECDRAAPPSGPGAPPQPLPPSGVARPSMPPDRAVQSGADPTRALGAESPMCKDKHDFDAEVEQSCRLSGSIARPYPVGNYGLDVQIDFDVLHLWDSLMGVMQTLAAAIWLVFVHLINGVLLLMEWAFSLDMLGENGVAAKLQEGMTVFHERVFGESWTLAALAAAGLWGLWWGLVRGKTIETITGLATTVAMMVLALLIIYRPDATVLPVSQIANDASKQVFTGISQGSIRNPTQGFADGEQGIFNSLVLRPWCALQFGDVDYCLSQRAPGGGGAALPKQLSVADAWLEFPPNSLPRAANYAKTAGRGVKPLDCTPLLGDGGPDIWDWFGAFIDPHKVPNVALDEAVTRKVCDDLKNTRAAVGYSDVLWADPPKVQLQESGGTISRIALMALIVAGLVGAILVFGYLAVRLMLAAVFTLLLLLMAPVLLLVAALGNAGRATFVAWFKRLIGQVVAKFVYALFLALVVLEAGILSSLGLGFYAVWLLQIAFWWGVFFKRHDLIGFISLDQRSREGGGLGLGSSRSSDDGRSGFGLAQFYYGSRMAGQAARMLRAAPRAGARRIRRANLERTTAESRAMREHELDNEKTRGLRDAQGVVSGEDAREEAAKGRKADLNSRRTALKERKRQLEARRARLDERKKGLQGRLGLFKQREREILEQLRVGGEAERDGLTRQLAENRSKQGAEESGIARIDGKLQSMPGQIGVVDRGIGRWSKEIANTDEELERLADERTTPISRAAHDTVAGARREDAEALFDPASAGPPGASRDVAPLTARERRERRVDAIRDGTAGDLSKRVNDSAREAKRQSGYERKRRKLEGRRRVR